MAKRTGYGLAGFLLAMGAVRSAHATDFLVTDTADTYVQGDGVCSLREAVDTANYNDCWTDCGCGDAGDVDTVSLSSGVTYTLNSRLDIWDAVVLWGNHGIIRAASSGYFNGILVQQTSYTEFQNVILENFKYSALVIDTDAAAWMWGLEVRNNSFAVGGGQNAGITLLSNAYLYLYGANIHDNIGSIKGGGFCMNSSSWLDLEASYVRYNTVSQYGGGVHNQGHFHCYGGTFISGNSAVYGGGGVYNTTAGVFDGPSNSCFVLGNTSTMGANNIGGHL
jgi:CSLREA domain-containing protein